jgi:hypothetical protein
MYHLLFDHIHEKVLRIFWQILSMQVFFGAFPIFFVRIFIVHKFANHVRHKKTPYSCSSLALKYETMDPHRL